MENNTEKNLQNRELSVRNRNTQKEEVNNGGEEQRLMEAKKEAARKLHIKNTAHEHLTTLAHACILVFTLYVIYKSITATWEVFTLHPLFYAVGWIFIMTEAVLLFSKDNVFTSKIDRTKRVKYHWILQSTSVTLSTIAFLTSYFVAANNQHFQTWHGLFGITSMILCYVSLINGTATLYWSKLKPVISPRINKMSHTITGFLTVMFGLFTVLLSLYSRWFNENIENNGDIFFICFVVVFCGLFWSLVIPGVNLYRRIKSN